MSIDNRCDCRDDEKNQNDEQNDAVDDVRVEGRVGLVQEKFFLLILAAGAWA